MSNVMMFSKPAAPQARNAPTTPPAGPDKIVRTGSFAAAAAEMLPPDDCITFNLTDLKIAAQGDGRRANEQQCPTG